MEYLDQYDVLAVVARVLRCDSGHAIRRTDLDRVAKVLDTVRAAGEVPEAAAALVCGLIRERPFVGPTTMIAMALTLQFAALNGYELELEPVEPLDELLLRLRGGEASESEVEQLLHGRLTPVTAPGDLSPDDLRLDPSALGLDPAFDPWTLGLEPALLGWEDEIMGRTTGMYERFTDPARRVIAVAQDEARVLQHAYVGTEHLLLGLLGVSDSPVAKILAGFGISPASVRETVREIIGAGNADAVRPHHFPFTPRAKNVLEAAYQEARGLGQDDIGPEHLLLGLLRDRTGVAAQVVDRLGANPDELRRKVLERYHRRQRSEAAVHELLTEENPIGWEPHGRRRYLLAGLTALLDENERLHDEVERLREENQRLHQENQRLHDQRHEE